MSFASFFRNFGHNFKADPASSLKGIVSLAAAGATAYGMVTGKVPVNELSLGAASAMATSGIHALGSDTVAAPLLEGVTLTSILAEVVPRLPTVAEHYEAIRQEGGEAAATLATIAECSALLEEITAKQAAVKP